MIARPMSDRDRRYVVSTWERCSRYSDIPRRYAGGKRESSTVADCVIDAGATVIVLATDDRTVHAWACAEDGTLHFVYVPEELRGRGLGAKVIALALGEYPQRIQITHPWPLHSQRFVYSKGLARRLVYERRATRLAA